MLKRCATVNKPTKNIHRGFLCDNPPTCWLSKLRRLMDLNFSQSKLHFFLQTLFFPSASMFRLSSAYILNLAFLRHAFHVNGATFARTDIHRTLKTQRVPPQACVCVPAPLASSRWHHTDARCQAAKPGWEAAWQGACAPHTRTCVHTLHRLADFYSFSILFISSNAAVENILTDGPQWVWKSATGEKLLRWDVLKTLISLLLLS